MDLLRVGWRNLLRNRRRTILNVAALAIGTAIMIVSIAWVRGYFTSFYEGIINLDTGHAQVLHREYHAEQRRLPLDLSVADYEPLRNELMEIDAVIAVAARLTFAARIGDGTRATHLVGRGIEPAREAQITVIDGNIVDGSYLSEGIPGVLLSSTFASRLGVSPGDEIVIDVIDRHGAPRSARRTLEGTFRLGYPAIDESMFFMDLPSVQELLAMEGRATQLVLRLDSGPSIDPLPAMIRDRVGRLRDDPTLTLEEWRTFVAAIVSLVEADIAGFSIIIVVLYVLVIIGILNSMSMAVHERTREIGTLRAIGMKRGQLIRLFLAEGVGIALLGAATGVVLAAAAGLYFGGVGFDLTALEGTGLPIPFAERFTADFRVWDFVAGTGVGVLTATAGSIIPARRASRLQIADALRSHLE